LSHRKNPFEEYDLDPREGPRAITERLRELAEQAQESERGEIRAAWEELTLHPLGRIRAAWGAHPSYPLRAGEPPTLPPEPAAAKGRLALRDLAVLPSVAQPLGPPKSAPASPAVSLDEDPVLQPGRAGRR
jgi:hypothetical protein